MASIIGLRSQPKTLQLPYRESRPFFLKTIHLAESLFRQVSYSLNVLYYRFTMTTQHCGQKIEWVPDSRGLIVLLHGLRNNPAAWYAQRSLLCNERKIDVFFPVVPKRGICSLDEAAQPVFSTLLDYVRKHPRKPVCLLGVSNGSRIATCLETRLRECSVSTPVMVSTIAGVHLGTSRMDLLEKYSLTRHLYPEVVRQELKYCSPKAIDLLNQLRKRLSSYCAQRKYMFYASTEDLVVPDLDSSLPHIGKGERCYVVHGHSHDSIVSAVARHQISSCLKWMEKN